MLEHRNIDTDSLVFYMEFPIADATWSVQCCVTNMSVSDDGYHFNEEADIVRVMNAKHNRIRLDERSWKALLDENDLLGEFCERMLSYLSFLMWTIEKPMAEA